MGSQLRHGIPSQWMVEIKVTVDHNAEFDRMVATLRAHLEEAAFNAAWAHRQALSIEDDAFAVFMAAPAHP